MKVYLGIPVDTDDLAEALTNQMGNYDDLIKFILAIDELVCDWDFTKSVYEKYSELMKNYGN